MANARIAGRAQKATHRSGVVAVVYDQVLSFAARGATTDGAHPALSVHHRLVVITTQPVLLRQLL